jgi:hypothetical protein
MDKQEGSIDYYKNKYTIFLVYKTMLTAVFGYTSVMLVIPQFRGTFDVHDVSGTDSAPSSD